MVTHLENRQNTLHARSWTGITTESGGCLKKLGKLTARKKWEMVGMILGAMNKICAELYAMENCCLDCSARNMGLAYIK